METAQQTTPKKKVPKVVLGTCPCSTRTCDKIARIKKTEPVRYKTAGKLYLDCEACGLIMPTGQSFQDYILNTGTFYGPDGKPEEPEAPPVPKSEPPAPKVEPEKKPTPASEVKPTETPKEKTNEKRDDWD
jgi:hypothetical protein